MALTTQALAAINGLALDWLMRAQSMALTIALTKLEQNVYKSNPKTNQKIDFFLEGFQIDFGWMLAPSWDPRGGGHLKCFLGVLRGLGKMVPRGPKSPPDDPLVFCYFFA